MNLRRLFNKLPLMILDVKVLLNIKFNVLQIELIPIKLIWFLVKFYYLNIQCTERNKLIQIHIKLYPYLLINWEKFGNIRYRFVIDIIRNHYYDVIDFFESVSVHYSDFVTISTTVFSFYLLDQGNNESLRYLCKRLIHS